MSTKRSIICLTATAAIWLMPMLTFAQQLLTNKEWLDTVKSNPTLAEKELEDTFRDVQKAAIQHYRDVGNQPRAHIVETMSPDMLVLGTRAAVAEQLDPHAAFKAVVQGYIVSASASPHSAR